MSHTPEAITARDAYAALLKHGRAIKEELHGAFSPPILDAFQRIGDAACNANITLLGQAASYHPVQEVPYTVVPPDFPVALDAPRQLPRGRDAINARLREYWPLRKRHDQSSPGIGIASTGYVGGDVVRSLKTALVSMDGALGMDDDTWEMYTRNHAAEHSRDFCTLPFQAADHSGRRYPVGADDFTVLERQLIEEQLTYSYPTMLKQITGSLNRMSQTVALPLSPELRKHNSGYAERLLRAAAFIIESLEVDEIFHKDIARVAAVKYDLVKEFTLRSRDQPEDVFGSGLRGTQESVGRAVLPLVAELLRGHEADAPAVAELIAKQNVAARVTRLVPQGYIGPVGLQGVGTTDQITDIIDGKVTISQEVRSAFALMNDRWRTEFHYPRLAAYLQEMADGNPKAQRDERTGLMCPFATTFHSSETGMSSPGVVAEAAKLLIALAELMPEQPTTPTFDRNSPYRPWEALPLVRKVVLGKTK